MNKINVPFFVWLSLSLSSLLVSGGYVLDNYRRTDLAHEMASLHAQAITQDAAIVIKGKVLEQIAREIKETHKAQSKIVSHYDILKSKNQPIIMFAPTIEEIRELNNKNSQKDLQELENSAQKLAIKAMERIILISSKL